MKLVQNLLKKMFFNSKGTTLIEIALYLALVVIVSITVVSALGDKLRSVFQSIVNSL